MAKCTFLGNFYWPSLLPDDLLFLPGLQICADAYKWTASWPSHGGSTCCSLKSTALATIISAAVFTIATVNVGSGPSPGASLGSAGSQTALGMCLCTRRPGQLCSKLLPALHMDFILCACMCTAARPMSSAHMHVPLFHWTSLPKHKFKDKIMNFMVVIAEH